MRLGSQSEMDTRSTSLILSLICLLAPLFWPAHGSQIDVINEENVEESAALGKPKGSGAELIWLGAKHRSHDEDEEKQDSTIMELIKESPWALISLKGNTQNTLNFPPWLGRESREEEMVFTETSRSPPFAPRLGRRMPFSPRLGRALYNSRPFRPLLSQ